MIYHVWANVNRRTVTEEYFSTKKLAFRWMKVILRRGVDIVSCEVLNNNCGYKTSK
jgi:hypothetical protein